MGLLDELKKALAERILNTEMEVHLDRQSEQAEGVATDRRVRRPTCSSARATSPATTSSACSTSSMRM